MYKNRHFFNLLKMLWIIFKWAKNQEISVKICTLSLSFQIADSLKNKF